jgi:hypothetical protein
MLTETMKLYHVCEFSSIYKIEDKCQFYFLLEFSVRKILPVETAEFHWSYLICISFYILTNRKRRTRNKKQSICSTVELHICIYSLQIYFQLFCTTESHYVAQGGLLPFLLPWWHGPLCPALFPILFIYLLFKNIFWRQVLPV